MKKDFIFFADDSIIGKKKLSFDTSNEIKSLQLINAFEMKIIEGDKDYQILPNKKKGEAILMKYYECFEYPYIFNTALYFYKGEIVNKNLEFARKLFKFAADSPDREDEDATKLYIKMCLNGEGGPECTPESYIKQVADSYETGYETYSYYYAKILCNKGEYYYENALHYLDRAHCPEASELASKIRSYLEAKRRAEEARQNQERESSKSDLLGVFAFGAVLTGLALAPVEVTVGALAAACFLGGSKDDDSD